MRVKRRNTHGDRQLKALVVEPVGGHGGMTHYDVALCRALMKAGIDVTLATCDVTDPSAMRDIPVINSYRGIFGEGSVWLRVIRFVRGTLEAYRYAKSRRCQLVHLHFFGVGPLQILNVALARLMGLRVVVTVHDVESFDSSSAKSRFISCTYAAVDRVVAHNEVSRRELTEKALVHAHKIRVIPHGNHLDLEASSVSALSARSRIGIPVDEFVVGFFGQIKEAKGLDILIKAFASITNEAAKTKLRLLIAGRPWRQDFKVYQDLIENLGIRHRVSLFIRFIDDDELPSFYCAADVMVLPYRRIYQSGVILMAMALRRPVIVSDVPGMTEMITHGTNGLVFRNGDAGDLAKRIVWAERHKAQLHEMASRAYDQMRRDHDWELVGRHTASTYLEIV